MPAGAPAPLVFTVRLMRSGYQVTVRGAGTPARLRQLAHAAGLKEAGALDAIAGDPVTLDLTIQGPWLPAPDITSDRECDREYCARRGKRACPCGSESASA